MNHSLLVSPTVLFRVLVTMVVAIVAVGAYVTLSTTGSLTSTSQNASEQAGLAQLAAEASDRLRAMSQITQDRIDNALTSPEITKLTETQQAAIGAWLNAKAPEPPSSDIASLPVPLSMDEAIQFQSALDYLSDRFDRMIEGTSESTQAAASRQVADVLQRSIDTYYGEPSLANLRDLRIGLGGMQVLASNEVPRLSDEALTLREDLDSSINFLRLMILMLALVGGTAIILLGYYMARTNQRLLGQARKEQADLAQLTQNLEYRNDQLSALYNVFNEITDTLSLRYVVRATISESLRIMRADFVSLRILRGDELETVGAMTASGQEIEGIRPVRLGKGVTGRVAKRGRTMRIDEGGERMMAPPPEEDDGSPGPSRQAGGDGLLESGLIVPLIVGARVVGTLSCWSRQIGAFNESDERIIEMMASQVATAIVAADTTEKSENRAMHDPLTSLPNRRQLDEDVEGRLAELIRENRQAVVAMLDIDHFKRFNDEYGHRVGDVTLQKVASVLRSSARDEDQVYRYGGEEFVVVFTDSTPQDAIGLANRLRLAVESAPFSGEQLNPVGPVTVSIGLALLPEHGIDFAELIAKADRAMYRAKANGRNRVELWSDEAVLEAA